MEPKEKKAFEPSGLVPRSIVRTFERFRQQLLPGSETAAIREYRISRYQVLVSARCLFTLLIIPIATNWLVSSWLLSPLVEHFWNTQQNEIFLNSYQEERAFAELESFSEKLFFESLLNTTNTINVDFTLSSCDRNPIPHTPEGFILVGGKCYDKNFSSSSQSSVTNKLTSVTPLQSSLPLANQRFARGIKMNLQPLEVHLSGGYKSSICTAKQDKPSICQICAARINSPFNKFRETWYSSIFHPIKTSIALEELVQRERNSLSLQRANSFKPSTPCTVHSSGGYGVEFIQYEKYLPLPSWENKEELTPYDNSLTQPLLDLHTPYPVRGMGEPKFSYASSFGRSSATLVPLKFYANDDQTVVWLRFARDQQLKNFLLTSLPVQVHFSGGYIEKIPLGSNQAVRVNNGVKAWGTEAKTPFLLSVPIESTYDNSLKIKEKVQNKILELAIYYNQQTIISITNIVGDVVSLVTLGCLFIWMKPEITILKSFLIEAIYSLSDTTKSFLLILLTDLLVGFHSPRGWETALELLLKHFGLPENQDFVFLFVATFPVLLDTVFKYWIFRHLNKISPSTVATYHSMIE